MTTTEIPATEIRKGDTVTLPSGRTVRIQRVHSSSTGVTELIFPAPLDGHAWLVRGTTVHRHHPKDHP